MEAVIDGFEVRRAVNADVPLILRFVKELAAYEKLEHEVVADEAQLRSTLFGEAPVARVLIGEYHGEPVGMALYFYNYSTFLGRPGIYLEDLYVRSAHRGKGFGRCMLSCLAKIACREGCGRLEWSVLDWNEPAIQFYRSLGARGMDEWTVFRLTGDALEKVAEH